MLFGAEQILETKILGFFATATFCFWNVGLMGRCWWEKAFEVFPVLFLTDGLSSLSVLFNVTITQQVTCNPSLISPDSCICMLQLIQMGLCGYLSFSSSFSADGDVRYSWPVSVSLSLFAVLPGRLWDGPSSPCRQQATSCSARPATSNSCWKTKTEMTIPWCCHRKAGSGSCRACCWAGPPASFETGLDVGHMK